MKHRYSLWSKPIYAITLLILLCSAVTPLPIQGVVAAPQEQEAQPTPLETQTTPTAPADMPVVVETQTAPPIETPVVLETQITAPPSEMPVISETQAAPPTETPVVLETQITATPTETPSAVESQTAAPLTEMLALIETPSEAPTKPTISREMPTRPALQQPESNILPPQTNSLLLAGEVQANAIANGGFHTCALTTGGGVKCWGYNVYGQLGNNSTTDSRVPVNVYGLTSGIKAIAAGHRHTCSITTSGGVKCWGDNYGGQLGNNGNTSSHVPQNVYGLSSGIKAIAAGSDHTCALTTGGGVKCWGYNNDGQLGNDDTTDSPVPVNVYGLTSGVQTIAIGRFHTCALTNGGGVKCWGSNIYGQLGNNATTDSYVPVNVSGLPSGVQAIAAGGDHTCALTMGGGVKCWGQNGSGQLGNNTTMDSHVPLNVYGLISGVYAIAAGGYHTCALTRGGGVKCWGYNANGQLGNNATTESHVPLNVHNLTSEIKAIALGLWHTCALTTNGGVKCWGYNYFGQLGNNSNAFSNPVPVNVVGFGPGFDSQFNGSMGGWGMVKGSWVVNNSSLYSSALGNGGYTSIAYTIYPYSTLDYSVRLMRIGCDLCATSIYIRGTGVSAFGNWTNAYQFGIRRDGSYLVAKNVIAKLVPIKNWTASSYINKGTAWNILRVVAQGSSLRFYINNTLVWSGSNTSFSTGKVGLGLYSNGTGGVNSLIVDYATLNTTVVGVAQALALEPQASADVEWLDPNGGNW